MEKLSDSTFEKSVAKSKFTFVDFFAEWCPPCKMVEPIVEELSKEYAGKIAFFKINVDENRDTAGKFGVMSIPTMVFFKEGKPVDTIVGAYPKHLLKAKLEELLKK
jgi:thioredoxin 1